MGAGCALFQKKYHGIAKKCSASCLNSVIDLHSCRFGCCACMLILVGSLWDVLSVWSLQEVGVVGWVLGLLCFKGMAKALSKHPSRASRLNGVMLVPFLLCV